MSKTDYYKILGVNSNATADEIKQAYRRLAMKHHPDRNHHDTAAEEKFKQVKEAYEVLSDHNKRGAYDRFGHSAGGSGPNPFGGAHDFRDIFGDVFGDIFGSMRDSTPRSGQRGADMRYCLDISLEDAALGKAVVIEFMSFIKCKECLGNGAQPGSKFATCADCNGRGQVTLQRGFFTVQQTCQACNGKGKSIVDPCQKCHGRGRYKEKQTITVNVPAGVDHGDRMRFNGQGEAGEAGCGTGDLYVEIQLKPHPIFERKAKNLYCDIPIAFVTAALGGELDVPTINGRAKLKIPAGTQTGKAFRLKGTGMPSLRGGAPGDTVCRIIIETPVHLTDKQQALLKEFEQTLSPNNIKKHSPHATSWFTKVKKFFEDMKF
jgi:molecular chaperone DnaJ